MHPKSKTLLGCISLLNESEFLIVDVLTAGLDPKELIRIRNFISEIAKDKIVLSQPILYLMLSLFAKEIILLKEGHLVSHDTCENLAKEIENKVFEIEISQEDLLHFHNTYRVSNLYRNGDKIILRTVTDNLPEDYKSTKVSPTLEDLYLYVFENGD